ncbi:MAG: hypothetical protein NUV67_02985 [archaeon]|nr:hypothetical protein [archaeon]
MIEPTPQQKEKIFRFKREGQFGIAMRDRGVQDRTLKDTNDAHNKNFRKITEELSRAFPGETLNVVLEGNGDSSFGYELNRGRDGTTKVNVIRTDISPSSPVEHNIFPEELAKKIPANSAHLVVSTFGGVTYTKVSQEKAIANIIHILKPGGIASIATAETFEFTRGRQVDKYDLWRIEQRFRNITINEKHIGKGEKKVVTVLAIRKLH